VTKQILRRERPDTIRSIVANLVGDDDSGDSLVDENEPIQPLQQPEIEDYSDIEWQPEPIDAGPGMILVRAADSCMDDIKNRLPGKQAERCHQHPCQHL